MRKAATYIAYTPKLDENGKFDRWLEIGTGRMGKGDVFEIHLDRMPVNPDDFTGYICLSPIGTTPIPPAEEDLRW
jgi:hypothetical protein